VSTTEAAPLLEVHDLKKSFGRVKAVDGVNLVVRPGEFVALLGANGAGKSSLLQMLAGLFTPDSGTIKVAGLDLSRRVSEALGEIGVVFQQPTLDLELSVRANLLFHADLQGLPRRIAKERAAAALARFSLTDRARDQARTLSGGNRRRVELARALLHRPRILLMDEATVGLDPPSRRTILADVVKLKSEGRIGVLWATHLVDEVDYADRLLILRRGRVLYDGTSRDFADQHPAQDRPAALIRMMGDEGNGTAGAAVGNGSAGNNAESPLREL
jgi:ABC-2 type transport system ATP-binding protein